MRTRRVVGTILGWFGILWTGVVFLAWVLMGWVGVIDLPGVFDAVMPAFWSPHAVIGRLILGFGFFGTIAPGIGALFLAGRLMAPSDSARRQPQA